jgi:two-component system NtrC family sensor kinase
MPRRLAPKLMLSLTVIVIVIEAIFGFINVGTQQRELLDAMILGADQLSKGITSATWHSMLADRRQAAYEVMQTIALKQGIDGIRIFNKEGRIMFSTNAAEQNSLVDKDAEACSLCHASLQPLVKVDVPSRVRMFRGPNGNRRLAMVTPIYNEPSCSQAACHAHPREVNVLGVLDVALDLDPVDRQVADMRFRVFLVSASQVLLIGVFIIFFTRRFVGKPIRRLIEGTKAVSVMDLDRPISIEQTSEELNLLSRSFDTMRERLRQALAEINRSAQDLEAEVQKRTEQLRITQLKLVQADRLASLGQLSASVAHEINNPISGVLNLSMLMQRIVKDDGIPPHRLPEFRGYLAQVVNQTSRVGRIVADLLSFSRRAKPQSGEASLNQVITATLSLVSHKLKLGNVEVELGLEEGLPPVFCDASQIQQVVMNLLLNAAEAMQGRGYGRLIVRSGRQISTGAVFFSVQDDGEGIPGENLEKIFDPFFTTKAEGKGVGLGLAVSYGIVKAHGGDIEVTSKAGEGSTFKVVLPAPAPESPLETR